MVMNQALRDRDGKLSKFWCSFRQPWVEVRLAERGSRRYPLSPSADAERSLVHGPREQQGTHLQGVLLSELQLSEKLQKALCSLR